MSDIRDAGFPFVSEDAHLVASLRERVSSLESLIADLRVGVLVLDAGGEVLLANEAARAMLGLETSATIDALGAFVSRDAVRDDGSPFVESELPISVALRTGEPVRDVVVGVLRPSSGERMWLLANVDPVLGPDGRVERLLITVSDITEWRRAEGALRESESLNRRILDAVSGGILHTDVAGTVVRANREALRTLGLKPEDLGRVTCDAFAGHTIYEDGLPYPPDAYPSRQCVRTGRRVPPRTIGLQRADGTISWAVYAAIPLFDAESREVTGSVVTFVDITERKQIEEHLRHVQRVEAVARLAGGVAHHFNNLLTVINGYASLMMKRLAPTDPLAEDAAEIRKAADRAAQLTRQLMAFNRRHVVDRRVVDVNVVVTELRPMLAPLFGEIVRLEIDLGARPATIWADPAQIEDIILNLAVNARDAMPRGGTFTLVTRSEVRSEPDQLEPAARPGRYVVLEAVDTGVGMNSEVLSHVFEPFFTTKEVGQGTGLGLSTVHEIVRQSGGWIDVRSEVDHGSTFVISLPEVDATVLTKASNAMREPRRGRETVLVVEDDESVRTYVRESLMRTGYRVLEAADGRAAIDLAAKYPGSIAVLVADIVMPEIGGVALATALLETRPRLRVLFISGYAGGESEPVVLERARFERLDKPFTTDDLAERIRMLLDGK